MQKNRFEQYIALRYLRGAQGREEGRRFLRFITYVAIGGVTVGVAALLLALSIVRGFSREIEAKIVGFGAHVQVENFRDEPLQRAGETARAIASMPGVAGVSPVVQEFALLRHTANEIDGVAIWGTDAVPAYLRDQLVEGTLRFSPDEAGRPGLVIGRQLARLLGIETGDVVTAFSMRRLQEGLEERLVPQLPRVRQFHVAGIYETSLANFDELYVLTDIDVARTLLAYEPDQAARLDVTLYDVEQAAAVARRIEETFGFPIMARTVFEVFRGLFAWVNLQESIIPLVISSIVLVAAFNIIGILLMIVLEKTREIGILESMGASSKAIRRLFVWLGLLIGLVGTFWGEVLALTLALLQQQYEIIPLPAEAYYMTSAPIELNVLDFVIVGVVTVVLCVAAAYFPARVASRIDPVRVVQFR